MVPGNKNGAINKRIIIENITIPVIFNVFFIHIGTLNFIVLNFKLTV
jgi:hypothetical protein